MCCGCGGGQVSTIENPPETKRLYSSTIANHDKSKLDSDQAWSAENQPGVEQWMEIDLGLPMEVSGVVTQGRHNLDQWVKTYKVSVKVDGEDWEELGEFPGNTDRDTKVENMFDTPKQARYMRILPLTQKGHMSMRAAAIIIPQVGYADAGHSPNHWCRNHPKKNLFSLPTGSVQGCSEVARADPECGDTIYFCANGAGHDNLCRCVMSGDSCSVSDNTLDDDYDCNIYTVVPDNVCTDTANGALNSKSLSCTAYDNTPGYCEYTQYDDEDFMAADACCVCGGGNGGVGLPAPTPAPTSQVLECATAGTVVQPEWPSAPDLEHQFGAIFDKYGDKEDSRMLVFSDTYFPSSYADGILFEAGGKGRGCWIGINNNKFRVQAGDGGRTASDDSDVDIAVISISLPDDRIPRDEKPHEVAVKIITTEGAIHLYIDG
jgi:hypothetical protein